jgi:hypothetical protein
MANETTPPKEETGAKLDRTVLSGLFTKLDPTFAAATLDGILAVTAKDDATAIQKVFDMLRKVVLNDSTPYDATKLADTLKKFDAAFTAGATGKVVGLKGVSSDQLLNMAQGDMGARYALANLLPFAIVESDKFYDQHNRDGSLFKFDPESGERLYTDDYLKDRANFLAVVLSTPPGDSAVTVNGTQSWSFEDRTRTAGDGGHLHIDTNATGAERATNRMTFGANNSDGENMAGGNGADRLYGAGGDDNLRGAAGDDYLEGGQGNDLLEGGRGADTLNGGQGEDELDGGAGNDKLIGGNGADDLSGGEGDDRLEGGNGFDSYNIETGSGNDVIVDADGKGEVLLDGVALTGGATFDDGAWRSADGKIGFRFAGDSVEGGTLTIEFGEEDARQTIKIHDFVNGKLGIKLGDGTPAALENQTSEVRPPRFLPQIIDDDRNAGGSGAGDGGSGGGKVGVVAPSVMAPVVESTQVEEPAVTEPSSLFANDDSIPLLSGDQVANAVSGQAPSLYAEFATKPAVQVAEFHIPGVLSVYDVTSAITVFDAVDGMDGLLGSDAESQTQLLDQALARTDKQGPHIGTRLATSLQPAELSLGKVGLGDIGVK